jgi:hypothetical protein
VELSLVATHRHRELDRALPEFDLQPRQIHCELAVSIHPDDFSSLGLAAKSG